MNKLTLIATSTFGLEALVKKELLRLGFDELKTSDGAIEFEADLEDIPRLNICLRMADRVLVKLAEFKAGDFDELFEGVESIAWEDWIPVDAKMTVLGKSVKSKLSSVRVCQSMTKKAMIKRLVRKYHVERFSETGDEFTVQISILKDIAQVTLDTTGAGLHKRGYRTQTGEVPLRETLAAALVSLSSWTKDQMLIDPMCGSGTILIEAAMMARNIAPGINRSFISERWSKIPAKVWTMAREEAKERMDLKTSLKIFGYDIDSQRIEDSMCNARKAGVQADIVFHQRDIAKSEIEEPSGVMISNPPYGIKLSADQGLDSIYKAINNHFQNLPQWGVFVLTADKKFPQTFKRSRPDKVRKLYNGTIETAYYQYCASKIKSPIKIK